MDQYAQAELKSFSSQNNYEFCKESYKSGWDINRDKERRIYVHTQKCVTGFSGEMWLHFFWYIKAKYMEENNDYWKKKDHCYGDAKTFYEKYKEKLVEVTVGYQALLMRWVMCKSIYEDLVKECDNYTKNNKKLVINVKNFELRKSDNYHIKYWL